MNIQDGYEIRPVLLKEYIKDKETSNYFFAGIMMGMQKAIGNLEKDKEIDPEIFYFMFEEEFIEKLPGILEEKLGQKLDDD